MAIAMHAGNSYGDNVISGAAQLQQGDNYIYNYYPWRPQVDKYTLLYNSLAFERIDSRYRSIEYALSQTCEWVYTNEAFTAWTDPNRVDEHHGLLWFKGKPGSGKSTIMKKLLDWARSSWTDEIILFYFFDGRAPSELEKSCLGLYRSLLYQLLSTVESVRSLFVSEFSSKEGNSHVEDWTEVELKNFFLRLLKDTHVTRLNIFVDALDEGDEIGVQDMLLFFDEAARYSMRAGSNFRLCLSSRHYPQIVVEKGLSITLENQPGHLHDIELYVERAFPGKRHAAMNEVREALIRKSEHIFLWVILSVSLLKPLYHKGRIKELRTRLDKIPAYLDDLFSKLITKNSEYLEECITLLQWMVVCQRPLTPTELYLAIQVRHDASSLDDYDDSEQVLNFILDCSRGLIELTMVPNVQIQFIHDTVRQFLIAGIAQRAGPSQICSSVIDFRQATCHATVAGGCLEYLLHISSKRPLNAETLQQFPLAKYAARYWGAHIRAAQSIDSMLLHSATQIIMQDQNRLMWLRIHNIDNLDNLEQVQFSFHLGLSDLAPPLYYAALIGSPALVSAILSIGADVNAQGGFYETALFAAANDGHDKVVEILLTHGANPNVQGEDGETALYAACIQGHQDTIQILLEHGADVNAQGGEFNSALQAASAAGHADIVRTLLERGADINAQGGFYGNALSTAAALEHREIVKILLPALIPALRDDNEIERLCSIFLEGGWTELLVAWAKIDEEGLRAKTERLGLDEIE